MSHLLNYKIIAGLHPVGRSDDGARLLHPYDASFPHPADQQQRLEEVLDGKAGLI